MHQTHEHIAGHGLHPRQSWGVCTPIPPAPTSRGAPVRFAVVEYFGLGM